MEASCVLDDRNGTDSVCTDTPDRCIIGRLDTLKFETGETFSAKIML